MAKPHSAAIVPHRAIGVNLVIFFAFALAALVLLTRTVLSAVQINSNVAHAIRPVIGGVQANTALLPVLDKTANLTAQIETIAGVIGSDLSSTVTATAHINATMVAVYQHVKSIGTSVDGIYSSVGSIRPTVDDIGRAVAAIQSESVDISYGLHAVAARVSGLPADIASASSSVKQIQTLIEPIDRSTAGIGATLTSINGHVVNISNNPVLQLSNLLQLTNLLGGGS